MSQRASQAPRPTLRGASHRVALFVFGAMHLAVWLTLQSERARLAVAIYAACHALLYGASACLHARLWPPRVQRNLQRLDHSAIFILIAGSYTPLFMLAPSEAFNVHPLALMWCFAALGSAKSLLWPHGPSWITATLAISMGWSGCSYALALRPFMGDFSFAMLMACGLVYSAGGLMYAVRRPDPWPTVFGYHECFHACVIGGSALHLAHTIAFFRTAGWM